MTFRQLGKMKISLNSQRKFTIFETLIREKLEEKGFKFAPDSPEKELNPYKRDEQWLQKYTEANPLIFSSEESNDGEE